MPELPEVETVRQILLPLLLGRKITGIEVLKKRIIYGNIDSFIDTLNGHTILNIERIGKYLIFKLDHDLVLVSHLRMEGKYYYLTDDEPLSRFARVVFVLDSGARLCYDDSRQFGTMELSDIHHYRKLKSLSNLGPEPFVAEPKAIFQQFQKTSRPIKVVLLDQTVLAGLGNIYVDEVLFLSQIHPEIAANLLSLAQVKAVLKHSIEVLNQAIKAGGSTVRSYQAGHSINGEFQNQLHAYGREYENCHLCGHKMKKIFVGRRGTTYCPNCQINPTKPICIAITGMIGAGKSTVGAYLRTKGYSVYDADQLVADLYSNDAFTKTLEKQLSVTLHEKRVFNKTLLKAAIMTDPKLVKKVESVVHPAVKQQIIDIIRQSHDRVIFFEIPLVFSHKINELFQYIIGVETTKELQESYLLRRGKAVLLTPDQQYLKHRPNLDAIIINNQSIKKLENAIDRVIKSLAI